MPLTPYHLGPGLFFGTIFFRYLNLFAVLVGSVILDLSPFVRIYILKLSYPWHGFFHTFLGAILVSFLLVLILIIIGKRLIKKLLDEIYFGRSFSFLSIFLSLLFGAFLHIFFDSFVHPDVFPFWPSHFNPFLNLISAYQTTLYAFILGIIGIPLLFLKIRKQSINNNIK